MASGPPYETEEFTRLAGRDPLTGLVNRQFFEQHLANELARAQRHHYPLHALLVDLDHFKQINERYGRALADLVLKEFAARLRKSIRTSDLAVRIRDDEFLVLLPYSNMDRVPHLLARLAGLEVDPSGEKIAVTFAAAWTSCQPDDQPELLFERLEQKVLTDKRDGGSSQALKKAQEEVRQVQNVEALERLASRVFHDFNNLLGLIRGYSELALDRLGLSDPLREYVEQIYQANERANSLTRQLLAFSRKSMPPPALLDLNALFATMEETLRRVVGQQITVVIRLEKELWPVKAGRGQAEQIILNLAANAHDSMPEGGTLTFETANVELDDAFTHRNPGARPGAYVMLAARDTGKGMDSEAVLHVFEPFSISGRKGAAGLGLAAVYGMVKQCGGYIAAESQLGAGTTFTIYLPRAEEVEEKT